MAARRIAFGLGVAAWLITIACNRERRPAERASATNVTRATLATPTACVDSERPLPNEGLTEPPGLGGCPPGMAAIERASASARASCIDRWEAFLVELGEGGVERTTSPYFNPEDRAVRAKSAPGAVPQGYIDQKRAARACERSGKRLCNDDEWLAACRGNQPRAFPYGDEERLGTCNDHRDGNAAFGDRASQTKDADQSQLLHSPCVNQEPSSLLRTGAKPGCVTSDQVYDLVGNLHEWTARASGAFRGGFYGDTNENGRGCEYVTTAHDPSYWDYSTGFRCCADLPR